MKILLIFPIIAFAIFSCSKQKECGVSDPTCLETVPHDELCQAAFNRYFFNPETEECEQISYSGCSQKGFETLQECQECECND